MNYFTEEQLNNINLPKWPGCDVDGDPVTPEQAMEILVRTNYTGFSTNDREFEKIVSEIYYTAIPHPEWENEWWVTDYNSNISPEEHRKRWNRKREYDKQMGILNIEYLMNDRVVSCYIDGPRGWCDWNGNIFQRGVNVGKWPSAIEIFNEWKVIAEAFPFLRLTCRLLNHEAGYSEGNPGIAVVYEVAEGKVKAREAKPEEYNLISSGDDDSVDNFISILNNPMAERGVSATLWQKACKLVAENNLSVSVS